MAGGLLNFSGYGDANLFLNGNPEVSHFRKQYKKATNFAMQKFRIDYFGQRNLRLTEESQFQFIIPRNADLLMDTYLVINLPNIYSPIYPPTIDSGNKWVSYDFHWIQEIGTQLIKEITITCGSYLIQKMTGQYLSSLVERDFTRDKKDLYDKMTGNTPYFYDPANSGSKTNTYPNCIYTDNAAGAEPSIRGKQLFIPINTWFSLDSSLAFPLINLQYNDLVINITLRSIDELFVIRDVFDKENNYPYIKPDQNREELRFYRFLQSPPAVDISVEADSYLNKIINWNADIHLVATYCFLSEEERKIFANENQFYLIKDIFQYNFQNIVGTNKVKLTSSGMVSSWMWYLQRNDAFMRNEWSNYTNYPYILQPQNVALITDDNGLPLTQPNNGDMTGYFFTGNFNSDNQKEILTSLGIVFDGDYRENLFDAGIYNYIEKYIRTKGNAKEGLYCYNFCMNTDPLEYQPSGAINLSRFRTVELEINTFVPPVDPDTSNFTIICDNTGNPIGVSKQNWRLFEYNYNMTVFEERYNILSFINGNVGLMYAR